MARTAAVVGVDSTSDGRGHTWRVTVERSMSSGSGMEPLASDVPEDIRLALWNWLGLAYAGAEFRANE